MSVIYSFINENNIPNNLEPGKQYTTKVVSATWVKGDMLIKLEYLGEEYDPNNPQCLMPLTKTSNDS